MNNRFFKKIKFIYSKSNCSLTWYTKSLSYFKNRCLHIKMTCKSWPCNIKFNFVFDFWARVFLMIDSCKSQKIHKIKSMVHSQMIQTFVGLYWIRSPQNYLRLYHLILTAHFFLLQRIKMLRMAIINTFLLGRDNNLDHLSNDCGLKKISFIIKHPLVILSVNHFIC